MLEMYSEKQLYEKIYSISDDLRTYTLFNRKKHINFMKRLVELVQFYPKFNSEVFNLVCILCLLLPESKQNSSKINFACNDLEKLTIKIKNYSSYNKTEHQNLTKELFLAVSALATNFGKKLVWNQIFYTFSNSISMLNLKLPESHKGNVAKLIKYFEITRICPASLSLKEITKETIKKSLVQSKTEHKTCLDAFALRNSSKLKNGNLPRMVFGLILVFAVVILAIIY